MHILIVYESMFGNTRRVAQAIAEGLRTSSEVEIVPVGQATPLMVSAAEMLIVGAPTHVHGMSSATSRHGAAEQATRPASAVSLEPNAEAAGIRDWLATLPKESGKPAVAFDTRIKAPSIITGRASSGIAKALRAHGFEVVAEPESFLVTSQNELVEGELDRARSWAEGLVGGLVAIG